MIKLVDGKITMLNAVVSYYDMTTKTTIKVPTDSPSLYEEMVNRNTNLTSYTFETITLNEQQQERLDKLNNLEDLSDAYPDVYTDYIMYGYIPVIHDEKLNELYEESKEDGIDYLKRLLINELSNIRWKKESQNVIVDSIEVSTNRNFRTQFISELNLYIKDILEEQEYKFINGFFLINKEKHIKIIKELVKHTKSCFTAEKNLIDYINSINDIEELDKLYQTKNEGSKSSSDMLKYKKLQELFIEKYNELYSK